MPGLAVPCFNFLITTDLASLDRFDNIADGFTVTQLEKSLFAHVAKAHVREYTKKLRLAVAKQVIPKNKVPDKDQGMYASHYSIRSHQN